MPKETRHDRRRFLRNAAMTIAVAEFGMIGSAESQTGGLTATRRMPKRQLAATAPASLDPVLAHDSKRS
jgi:hypothetical protein